MIAASHIQRPNSARKPLQPRNFRADDRIEEAGGSDGGGAKAKLKPDLIASVWGSNKENLPNCTRIESFDPSLAEELSAARKKVERLRSDKERTEKTLRERDLMFGMKMKELLSRGEVQKQLEMEVDRLYRLRQLHTTISPIRSLREKEHGKKVEEAESQDMAGDEGEEEESSVGENNPESPSSVDAGIVTEK